jgi:hypothetical protein
VTDQAPYAHGDLPEPRFSDPTQPVSGQAAVPSPIDRPLVIIGDITCTQTSVWTPSGGAPIGRVTWNVADMTRTDTAIPAWAIVLAILFFVFCLLGLLFLLVKEKRVSGWMQVTVQGPELLHTTQIPISSAAQSADVHARVSYARTISFGAARGY